VELLGFVSEENKPRFYAEADLAVFPATGGESFGIVLIEAMAAGAGVVVGGDNPGYRSVLGDDAERAGTLVDPRDSAAMADAITALVEDPGLRTQLHKQQAEHVRRYDIDVVGPQLLELYGRPS
jgi:phosphatidylinositol alpha-mannosyltransferase